MAKDSTKYQEINRRRQLVSKLRHEGVRTQSAIAERLRDNYGIDVTQQTVSNDLKALDQLWKSSALANTDKWKNEVAKQYRYLYQQSIAAWELSLEDAEEVTTEDGEDGEDSKEKTRTRTKGQSGNPAHLRNAQESLKAIRDLLGLDSPIKTQNFNFDLSKATDEQLQRIANGEDPAHVLANPGTGGT